MASFDEELEQQLIEAGNKLLAPLSSVDKLLPLLDQIEICLSKVEKSPTKSTQSALAPYKVSLKALLADQLFRYSEMRAAVASCISEINRITAPGAPYVDDRMQDVFQLIVSSFGNLSDKSSGSYDERTSILDTVAQVRSCAVMLGVESDARIIEMFQHFLSAIRDYHPENVFTSMETIMVLVLQQREDISSELLSPLLATVKKGNKEVLPIACKLGEKVLENCANKVKPYLLHAVKSSGVHLDGYSDVVASICKESSSSVKRNDALTADEKKAGKEIAEEAGSPKLADPINGKSPMSVVSNGVPQTCEYESLADSCSLKKQDDSTHADQSKSVDTPSNADPNSLDAEKLVHDESKPEEASKKNGRKVNSSTKSAEPSWSSHFHTEKDAQKPVDDKAVSKDILSSPHEETFVKAAMASENKKEAGTNQPSSPKALEGEYGAVAFPSKRENLPMAAHSKKRSLIKDSKPSADDVSRKTCEEISDSEAKLNKRSKKESSKPSVGDVSRKTSEGISDSEAKINKRSSIKTPGKISNEEKTLKTAASKKEIGATSESQTKPLKKAPEKVHVSSKIGDGSSFNLIENKKQQSRGISVSEKNVSRGSIRDDDKVL
ncbi:sister chromatid cohesion protein PDS5 homolog C-like [Euphorbia lathyris]|uniref:sister chromatid cohesion protein PDS5 homolog C-like n=1 Tax=Euphorbia lathyris TaxID=212925 RepID=UPI003313EC52